MRVRAKHWLLVLISAIMCTLMTPAQAAQAINSQVPAAACSATIKPKMSLGDVKGTIGTVTLTGTVNRCVSPSQYTLQTISFTGVAGAKMIGILAGPSGTRAENVPILAPGGSATPKQRRSGPRHTISVRFALAANCRVGNFICKRNSTTEGRLYLG